MGSCRTLVVVLKLPQENKWSALDGVTGNGDQVLVSGILWGRALVEMLAESTMIQNRQMKGAG